MGKHYDMDFKNNILKEYLSGASRFYLGNKYNISPNTIGTWIKIYKRQGNLINDINHSRGRKKEDSIDYKERYEILKKYQAFLKAQREKK